MFYLTTHLTNFIYGYMASDLILKPSVIFIERIKRPFPLQLPSFKRLYMILNVQIPNVYKKLFLKESSMYFFLTIE